MRDGLLALIALAIVFLLAGLITAIALTGSAAAASWLCDSAVIGCAP